MPPSREFPFVQPRFEYHTLMAKQAGAPELNMLGKEGWEVVGVVVIMAATSALSGPVPLFVYTMKRHLKEELVLA